MQQHAKGVVGILLLVLLEIYWCLQQWKNFANLSTIDKVIAKINRVSAFWTTPYIYRLTVSHLSKNNSWFLMWENQYNIFNIFSQKPWIYQYLYVWFGNSHYLMTTDMTYTTKTILAFNMVRGGGETVGV